MSSGGGPSRGVNFANTSADHFWMIADSSVGYPDSKRDRRRSRGARHRSMTREQRALERSRATMLLPSRGWVETRDRRPPSRRSMTRTPPPCHDASWSDRRCRSVNARMLAGVAATGRTSPASELVIAQRVEEHRRKHAGVLRSSTGCPGTQGNAERDLNPFARRIGPRRSAVARAGAVPAGLAGANSSLGMGPLQLAVLQRPSRGGLQTPTRRIGCRSIGCFRVQSPFERILSHSRIRTKARPIPGRTEPTPRMHLVAARTVGALSSGASSASGCSSAGHRAA